MRYAAIVLVLAAATTTSASQMLGLKDGRAACLAFEPDKFSVSQVGQDWRIQAAEYGGYTIGILPTKEDAEAALEVIKKNKYTAVCTIGKEPRAFRYFESAR